MLTHTESFRSGCQRKGLRLKYIILLGFSNSLNLIPITYINKTRSALVAQLRTNFEIRE
jgi:hypothetical protein